MSDQKGHGGKRENSGRKTKYRSTSESTSIRLPKEYTEAVYEFLEWLDRETYPTTTDRKIQQYLESKDKQS